MRRECGTRPYHRPAEIRGQRGWDERHKGAVPRLPVWELIMLTYLLLGVFAYFALLGLLLRVLALGCEARELGDEAACRRFDPESWRRRAGRARPRRSARVRWFLPRALQPGLQLSAKPSSQ